MGVAAFSLVVSREDDTETIAVVGELDVATGVRLTEAIRTAEAGTAGRIVVDLSEVTSVDHPSVAMLWNTRVRLRRWGDHLEFVPPASEAVERFITLTGTSAILFGSALE